MVEFNILILEDEASTALLLKKTLEEKGYVVQRASTYEKAINFLKDSPFPDIAILDINLEGETKDGIDVAREIQKIKDIPIIFMTGYGENEEYFKKAQQVKPFNFIEKGSNLSRKVHRAIELVVDKMFNLEENSSDSDNITFIRGKISINILNKDHYQRQILNLDDINYIRGLGGPNIELVTKTNKYALSMSVGIFEKQIHDMFGEEANVFVRVHRSCLANINNIISYRKGNIAFEQPKLELREISLSEGGFFKLEEIFRRPRTKL